MGFEEVSETEEIKTEEIKTEEVNTEEVKQEEVKTEEVKPEETKTEETKSEEVKPEVTKTEEAKPATNKKGGDKKKKDGKGCAIASLILGILSCTICVCIGLITGLIGVITGIVALVKKTKKKATAIIGLITSILGMLLNTAIIVIAILLMVATVKAVTVAVGAISNSEYAEIISESFTDIDWGMPVTSFKEALIENAKTKIENDAISFGVEKIIGGNGITISDGNGNEYTIQGDSLQEATFTDEQTGEKYTLEDLEDLTGFDTDVIFDDEGNLDVEKVEELIESFYDEIESFGYGDYSNYGNVNTEDIDLGDLYDLMN